MECNSWAQYKEPIANKPPNSHPFTFLHLELMYVTQALSKINELPMKVGNLQCLMTFMVLDTDNYDILLGLDFLIKIGVVVDVEKGTILIRQAPKIMFKFCC
jgi:hypothetical protein